MRRDSTHCGIVSQVLGPDLVHLATSVSPCFLHEGRGGYDARMHYIDELRRAVNDAVPKLLALGDASATRRAPGNWSAREIIGHLVDSASNIHPRFVRGQLQDDLVFPGYAGDEWVRIGRYQQAPWEELVTLWRTLNLQIARVMEGTPEDRRRRPRVHHNFAEIGVTLPPGEAATLEHVMSDYVIHLQHHLRQIFADSQ
jgi:hypothetical protein